MILLCLGKHHDKLPKGEEMNKDVLPLLFEAITVNCNYTSKIEVRDEGFFSIAFRSNLVFRKRKKKRVVYQNKLVIRQNVLYLV